MVYKPQSYSFLLFFRCFITKEESAYIQRIKHHCLGIFQRINDLGLASGAAVIYFKPLALFRIIYLS